MLREVIANDLLEAGVLLVRLAGRIGGGTVTVNRTPGRPPATSSTPKFTRGDGTPLPIRFDLIDRAGTRYFFGRCTPEDAGAMWVEAHAEAARFHGTAQGYYEDDPERSWDSGVE